jgi:hypothetical protein
MAGDQGGPPDLSGQQHVQIIYALFPRAHHQSLLQTAFQAKCSTSMRMKMARRLSKLGSVVSDNVYQIVYGAAKNTETLLQTRWSSFQAIESISMAWDPEELDVVSDAAITLNNSRPYLIKALRSTFRTYSRSHLSLLIDSVSQIYIRLWSLFGRPTCGGCRRGQAHCSRGLRVVRREISGSLGPEKSARR